MLLCNGRNHGPIEWTDALKVVLRISSWYQIAGQCWQDMEQPNDIKLFSTVSPESHIRHMHIRNVPLSVMRTGCQLATRGYQTLAPPSRSQFLMVKAEAFSWVVCRSSFYRALAFLMFFHKGANSSSAAVLRTCISSGFLSLWDELFWFLHVWICHSGAELWASYMGSRYHLMLPAIIWKQRSSQKLFIIAFSQERLVSRKCDWLRVTQ